MSLYSIALKNVKRNFSFYSLYFVSVSFILTIFFSFVSFSMNKVMLQKISEDGRVESMIKVISVFLMAFVVFYMYYSNTFFVKRRLKELGIYTLLGYRKSQILKILTSENIIICIFAFVVGVLLGAAAHQAIVGGISGLLHLNINGEDIPLFNATAILYSAIFVFAVVIALSISNLRTVHKATLLKLVNLEKAGEKRIKTHFVSAALGLALMVLGDIILIDCMRLKQSVWYTVGVSPIGLLTVCLITVGTALFIYSFLPFFLQMLEKHKKILYKPTLIVTIPTFSHRIRTNAKTLVLLSLLSAATLCVFGACALSAYYPIVATSRIVPSAIEFRADNQNEKESVLTALENKFGRGNFSFTETDIIKVTAESDNLPTEYSISADKGRTPGFEVISLEKYNALLKQQNRTLFCKNLNDDECILVKYRPENSDKDIGNEYRLSDLTDKNFNLKVKETTLQNVIGFSNSVGTLVVSDNLYAKLKEAQLPVTKVVCIDSNGFRDKSDAYDAVKDILKDNVYFACAYERVYDTIYTNSSTFLLLGFLTVLFFIASGSILHFHNISAVSYDKSNYEILGKIGYSNKKIKAIVRKQILTFYTIPFALGLIHAVCGLICYKNLLMDDVMGSSKEIILPIILSLAVSALIYFIYFEITEHSCFRIALKAKH